MNFGLANLGLPTVGSGAEADAWDAGGDEEDDMATMEKERGKQRLENGKPVANEASRLGTILIANRNEMNKQEGSSKALNKQEASWD